MRVSAHWAVMGGVALVAACAGGESSSSNGGGGVGAVGGIGGATGGGGSPSGGGTGGSVSGGGTGGSVSGGGTGGTATGGGGASGSGGNAGAAQGGTGGTGGSTGGTGGTGGDAGPTWPTCDAQPTGVPTKTIPQVWADNSTTPVQVWVPGVFITAISANGCVSGQTCQIYLQQDESYASLVAGAKHALKMRIASTVAQHFVGLKVGDKVDAMGWGWRFNLQGADEIVLQVNSTSPGCAKAVGTGNPVALGVQYSDLTINAYEQTVGPLLVKLDTVTGKPALPTEIFGMWKTGVGIGDAGPESLVNASPYFLPNGAFTGLPTSGTTAVNFKSVTGVFSVYIPIVEAGTPPKYVVLYPRTMAEMAQ